MRNNLDSVRQESRQYVTLGERENSFYIGFRDEESDRLSGLSFGELKRAGVEREHIDGVLINPRDIGKIAVVRISKEMLGNGNGASADHLRKDFEYVFAIDVADRIGGFVSPYGVEPVPGTVDAAFMDPDEARAMQNRYYHGDN